MLAWDVVRSSLLRKGSAGAEEPLLTVSCRSFVVGKLESKFPSSVVFYSGRCCFEFHHHIEKQQVRRGCGTVVRWVRLFCT